MRTLPGLPTLPGIGPATLIKGGAWFNASAYADLAAIADFNNDRYALPALGPELVTNGGFDVDANWVKGTGWTIGGGVAVKSAGSAADLVQTPIAFPGASALIQLQYTISGYSAGSFQPRITGGVTSLGAARTANGTYTDFFTVSAGTTDLKLAGDASFVGSIDNVSVKEVLLTRGGQALGANLGANGYTMSVNGGTGTATESPTGQLNLTGDGTNFATGDKSFATVVGRRYRVMFTISNGSPQYVVGTSQGGAQNVAAASAPSGFNSLEFTATATTTWIRFYRQAAVLCTVTAIEIRELPAAGAYPKRSATRDEWLAFTAASDTARSYVDAGGVWRTAAYGKTNYIRNSSMVGAIVGAIGSGGSAPTGWNWDNVLPAGLTKAITGTGVENGMSYIEVEITGTAAAGGYEAITPTSGGLTLMAPGQNWVGSWFARLVSGTLPTTTAFVRFENSGAAGLQDASVSLSSADNTIRRFEIANVNAPASTAQGRTFVVWTFNSGVTYNFRMRLYGPQLEQGLVASPYTATTGSAITGGVNAPRFDFRNGKRQLRLEDARTNVVGSARNPSLWANDGATVTSLGTTDVNGFMPATIASPSTYQTRFSVYTFAGTSGTPIAIRTRYAAGTSGRVRIKIINTTTTIEDQITGTVGGTLTGSTAGGAFSSIVTTNIGGGVFETTCIYTPTANGNFAVGLGSDSNSSGTIIGYGQQVENNAAFCSDWIFTSGAAVTRAIETARFSPLLEAVMQRAAGSVVLKGRLDYFTGDVYSTAQRLIGGVNPDAPLSGAFTSKRMGSWNGTTLLTTPSDAPTPVTEPFGSAWSADSAGRSVAMAGTVASDTAPKSAYDLTQVYLARPNTTPSNNPSYAAGFYDFVGISPERLSNANLQALAVAA